MNNIARKISPSSNVFANEWRKLAIQLSIFKINNGNLFNIISKQKNRVCYCLIVTQLMCPISVKICRLVSLLTCLRCKHLLVLLKDTHKLSLVQPFVTIDVKVFHDG
jgi:hypothetical protein